MRQDLDCVTCNLTSSAHLIFSTERINGQWYISRFESIYTQDSLVPVLPNNTLNINSKDLSKYRPSYACLSYILEQNGESSKQDLPGIDKPETVQKLYKELDNWLDGGKR